MAPYQVTIAYDGTDFFGFQRQKNHRTVQDELEKALIKLGWTQKSILASGRTDTGVHAEGQVIKFDLEWKRSETELLGALNSLLPIDIAAKEIQISSMSFHPRFSATSRFYRYQIYFSPMRNPLLDRYNWRVWPKPDNVLLKNGTEKIIGNHEFSSFGRPPRKGGSTERTIFECGWKQIDENRLFFSIVSESFLYHMVRRIVYVLIKIGQTKISAIDLEMSLLGQKDLPDGIAPANGLILEKVNY